MGQSSAWDMDTLRAYAAIREYRKAASLFLRAHPSPEASQDRFDTAKAELVEMLLIPGVADRISSVIDAGIAINDKSACSVIDNFALQLEIKLAPEYGLRKNAVEVALENADISNVSSNAVSAPSEMIAQLNMLHEKALLEVTAERNNPDRVEKKKRKRNIAQSITSALFGTGCLIGNSYMLTGYPHAAVSYAVGAAALHQSLRDVIGEAPKE